MQVGAQMIDRNCFLGSLILLLGGFLGSQCYYGA